MSNNHMILNKNWAAVYVLESKEKPLHLYHIKCAVSRGVKLGVKWVKCPKCKSKLPIWELEKAKRFIKACQLANFNVNI